uniref:Zmp:0000001267 n=1 Tax=Maylandia zebra TaxID=106582 RepID=A0A3P9BNF6_9CICH
MGHDTHGLNLQREVGLIGAVSFIGGTMIGSGIFISPQYVLSTIGSPGASFIIWSCCGLIAMLGGLCYAELGTIIPESGAEYIYILRTAGKVVAFMFVFSFIMVMRPASGTGVALIFAEYAVAPFYSGCTPPQLAVKLMAAVSILVLAIINCLSVRLATGIQVINNCGLNTWNSSPFVFRTLEASGMTGKMFLRHQKSQNLNIYCLCLILYKKRRQIDPRLWLFSQDCI